MAVWMQAPKSYTCEDVLEIHCHGGLLVTQRILELALNAGARLAEPGEFTKRAFLNGRIDLLQAEGVIDIIKSKTESSLRMAQHQREGLLSFRLTALRDRLRQVLALVEAHIDFPEEEIDPQSLDEVAEGVEFVCRELQLLITSYRQGKVLRDGVAVAIVGKPNVGKSSLLNTLLQEKRAIVTALPGTTRDVIEEVINIGGLPVRLLDTAGIRETVDEVEQLGIELTLDRISIADLVLFLVDSARPFDSDDQRILNAIGDVPVLLVASKSDLRQSMVLPEEAMRLPSVAVSTMTGSGIDQLRAAILSTFMSGAAMDSREFVALSQMRHRDALKRAADALDAVRAGISANAELEMLAIDLRESLHAIGDVTGETTPDDVLDLVFSRFCIGK
jgi:tRNA modification GTPase